MTSGRLRAWGPVLGLSLVVTGLSSIPAASMPPGDFWRFDKLLHAGEYAALGFLWCRALVLSGLLRRSALLYATLCAGGYGAVDELYQNLIPGRHSSIFDVAADFVGAVAGALIYLALTTEKNHGRHSQLQR